MLWDFNLNHTSANLGSMVLPAKILKRKTTLKVRQPTPPVLYTNKFITGYNYNLYVSERWPPPFLMVYLGEKTLVLCLSNYCRIQSSYGSHDNFAVCELALDFLEHEQLHLDKRTWICPPLFKSHFTVSITSAFLLPPPGVSLNTYRAATQWEVSCMWKTGINKWTNLWTMRSLISICDQKVMKSICTWMCLFNWSL